MHIRKRREPLGLQMYTAQLGSKGQTHPSIISDIFTPAVCNVSKPLGVRFSQGK